MATQSNPTTPATTPKYTAFFGFYPLIENCLWDNIESLVRSIHIVCLCAVNQIRSRFSILLILATDTISLKASLFS